MKGIKALVNNLGQRAAALAGHDDGNGNDGGNGNGNNNYYDGDGVPQPHIDGEPQQDYVYDYYIDRAIAPPWFEDYKERKYGIPIDWDYVSRSLQDGRTKDETAYLIRKYEREFGTLDECHLTTTARFSSVTVKRATK